ncbi:HCP-like protein [Umbelopsis sp. PMI_123]|nr:HCP-like protein [Umbelopsis sp. PMI_123]
MDSQTEKLQLSSSEKGKSPVVPLNLPAPTAENIRKLREQAKANHDPERQLAFALYLIDTVSQTTIEEQDPKQGAKARERMILEAQKIIKKLATQGLGIGKTAYPEAQFYLANCYGSGSIGLPVDYDRAFSLYLQASKQNHPAATYRTAVCYEIGAGTRRDYNHAMQFYRKAANLSYTIAMYKLGMILLKGHLNQTKNPREGIFWLKRSAAAATEDTPHAVHELGLIYEKDISSTVIADESYSFELFSKAAKLGYGPSQCKLGACYEYGLLGRDMDASLSVFWYRKAADQGLPEAELAVSGWYLTGSEGVIEQSDEQAYLWARRAADKGDSMGEFTVGYYTEIGIGINADVEEGKRWYMLAMSRGNPKAAERLKELKRIAAGRLQAENNEGAEKSCVIM